jgi:hypothetical protein
VAFKRSATAPVLFPTAASASANSLRKPTIIALESAVRDRQAFRVRVCATSIVLLWRWGHAVAMRVVIR